MLNAEKIKVMNRLAIYEKQEGKKYLPISKYYRSDYIGIALIKNFFLVTIGFVLAIAGLAVYYAEFLMDNINQIDIIYMGEYLLAAYVIVLLGYSVLTYIEYSVRYHRAKKSVRKYYQELTKLEKMYIREEKRSSGSRKTGGTEE